MLLNDADKVYVGGTAADAVYVAGEKVWSSGLDPISLGGLMVWLDASQLALADGAAVNPWPDLGGQANHGAIVGAPAPVVRANALAGKSVVRFKKLEGRVRGDTDLASSGLPAPGYNFSIFYVGRMAGPNVGRNFAGDYPATNFLLGYHTTGQDIAYDNGWLGTAQPYSVLPTPWTLWGFTAQHTGTVYSNAFYKNGVFVAGAATGGGLQGHYMLSGYSPSGDDETCDCEVAELLIYDHKLPDAERIQVEGYLRGKWGTP